MMMIQPIFIPLIPLAMAGERERERERERKLSLLETAPFCALQALDAAAK
jgi:hypothetical protein